MNLQFAHVVVNYDMPWNPMRIEQRIGRVDRIGQTQVVRAHNFMLQSSVEFRVREVLERKLGMILQEFGVDKTGDVLDSADAEQLFTDLFIETLLHPDSLDDEVDATVERVRERARTCGMLWHSWVTWASLTRRARNECVSIRCRTGWSA